MIVASVYSCTANFSSAPASVRSPDAAEPPAEKNGSVPNAPVPAFPVHEPTWPWSRIGILRSHI